MAAILKTYLSNPYRKVWTRTEKCFQGKATEPHIGSGNGLVSIGSVNSLWNSVASISVCFQQIHLLPTRPSVVGHWVARENLWVALYMNELCWFRMLKQVFFSFFCRASTSKAWCQVTLNWMYGILEGKGKLGRIGKTISRTLISW